MPLPPSRARKLPGPAYGNAGSHCAPAPPRARARKTHLPADTDAPAPTRLRGAREGALMGDAGLLLVTAWFAADADPRGRAEDHVLLRPESSQALARAWTCNGAEGRRQIIIFSRVDSQNGNGISIFLL